jgi:hypothetical protein
LTLFAVTSKGFLYACERNFPKEIDSHCKR